jgi:hypothetical protein
MWNYTKMLGQAVNLTPVGQTWFPVYGVDVSLRRKASEDSVFDNACEPRP